jgi:hypothetical protein
MVDNLIHPFLTELELEGIEEYEIIDDDQSQLLMDIIYIKKDEKGKEAFYRDHVPWKDISGILRDKSVSNVKSEYDDLISLNETELEYRHGLIRLIVAMLIYIQASENALVDGFPGNLQLTTEGQYFRTKGKTANKTLGSKNVSPKSVDSHYRAWHIRQLRDERYYQGEWIDKPQGSRFVFVKDTYVNDKEVLPKTLCDSET